MTKGSHLALNIEWNCSGIQVRTMGHRGLIYENYCLAIFAILEINSTDVFWVRLSHSSYTKLDFIDSIVLCNWIKLSFKGIYYDYCLIDVCSDSFRIEYTDFFIPKLLGWRSASFWHFYYIKRVRYNIFLITFW